MVSACQPLVKFSCTKNAKTPNLRSQTLAAVYDKTSAGLGLPSLINFCTNTDSSPPKPRHFVPPKRFTLPQMALKKDQPSQDRRGDNLKKELRPIISAHFDLLQDTLDILFWVFHSKFSEAKVALGVDFVCDDWQFGSWASATVRTCP